MTVDDDDDPQGDGGLPRIIFESPLDYGLHRPKIDADPDDPLASEREEQRGARNDY